MPELHFGVFNEGCMDPVWGWDEVETETKPTGSLTRLLDTCNM